MATVAAAALHCGSDVALCVHVVLLKLNCHAKLNSIEQAGGAYAVNWAVVATLPLAPSLITPLQQQQPKQQQHAGSMFKQRVLGAHMCTYA